MKYSTQVNLDTFTSPLYENGYPKVGYFSKVTINGIEIDTITEEAFLKKKYRGELESKIYVIKRQDFWNSKVEFYQVINPFIFDDIQCFNLETDDRNFITT